MAFEGTLDRNARQSLPVAAVRTNAERGKPEISTRSLSKVLRYTRLFWRENRGREGSRA